MRYRAEIDGLRAVAVVPVLFYHAGFRPAAGGFVGVDVFFVISGFLITSIILGDLQRGTFSVADFYERRARRILPALYVVLLVCLPFGYAWMLPDEFSRLLETITAALLFVSNFDVMLHTSYFAADERFSPLLHTWSLAVEEQYYLLAPALLLFCHRRGFRVALAIGVVTIGSLALAEYGWRHWPAASFLMLPFRAWELGIGSLAAIAMLRWPDMQRHRGFAEAGGAIGLGLIALSVLTFDKFTPHPSIYTLAPVAGTALVLLCAGERTLVGRLLSWRPVVFVGLISYSAYLWHQPLLAFGRIRSINGLTDGGRLAAIALALILAWLTWRFVERPFRNRAAVSRRAIVRFGAGATVALVLISMAELGGLAIREQTPRHLRQVFDVTDDQRYSYVVEAYNAHTVDIFRDNGLKKLLLAGDSFSQDFYNMMREVGAFADYEVVGVFSEPWCQVYIGVEEVTRFIEPRRRGECLPAEPWNERLVAQAKQADVIILAAHWVAWSAERLPETIAALGLQPDQTLFVIATKSFGNFNVRALYAATAEHLPRIRSEPEPEALAINRILRDRLPPEQFVDAQSTLCADELCPLFTPEGSIISYDGGHLTKAGARYLGNLIFADPRLRRYVSLEG